MDESPGLSLGSSTAGQARRGRASGSTNFVPRYRTVDNFGTGISDFRFERNAPVGLVAVEAASTDDEFHIGVIAMAIDLK